MTLTPEQRQLWEYVRPEDARPIGEQTLEQAREFAIASYVHRLCPFEGIPAPTLEQARAELERRLAAKP